MRACACVCVGVTALLGEQGQKVHIVVFAKPTGCVYVRMFVWVGVFAWG